MTLSVPHLVLVVLLSLLSTTLAQTPLPGPVGCPGTPGDVTCETEDQYAICVEDVNNNGTFYCACDEPNGFGLDAGTGTCMLEVGIGDVCQQDASKCPDNSVCENAGDNSGLSRCTCVEGYVAISSNQTDPNAPFICAIRQTSESNVECIACEENEGECYFVTPFTYCRCPSYRSGKDCENNFVNVTCYLETNLMTICYTLQPGDNENTTRLYTEGKANDEACKGVKNDAKCPNGLYLELPLGDLQRGRCGTEQKPGSYDSLRYQNNIIVAPNIGSVEPSRLFSTYCSYVTHKNAQFDPYGFASMNGNDQGEHKEPELSLKVLNSFQDEIPTGTAVQVGDTIFFQITLTDDGTYKGFQVEGCIASSDPNLISKYAFTRTLIANGCPAKGQTVFTANTVFKLSNRQPNVQMSGPVKVFPIPTKNSVFIHCRLKVCLQDVTGCVPVDCTTSAAGNRKKRALIDNDRRRRAVTDEEAQVSRELIIVDPNDNVGSVVMTTTGFVIMIVILALILLIFIVIIVLLFLRVRRGQGQTDKVGDTIFMTQKPQRFAMPRNERSQPRI